MTLTMIEHNLEDPEKKNAVMCKNHNVHKSMYNSVDFIMHDLFFSGFRSKPNRCVLP